MARMNAEERAKFLKDQEAQRTKERKEREPTIGGSIKAGAKKVIEALSSGGAADRASKSSAEQQGGQDKEIKRLTD